MPTDGSNAAGMIVSWAGKSFTEHVVHIIGFSQLKHPPTPEIKARNKRKLCTPNKAYQKLVWNVEMSRRYGMFLTVRGLSCDQHFTECARSRHQHHFFGLL